MSELGRGAYIFGSSRRRKSASMPLNMEPPYEKVLPKALDNGSPKQLPAIEQGPLLDDFVCKLCKKQYVDPRVLSCLHSFCLSCISDLINKRFGSTVPDSVSQGSIIPKYDEGSGSSNDSAVSGYESDVVGHSIWGQRNLIICPLCGVHTKLPVQGITGLTPHYILQHRMLIASLNEGPVCYLCDLCSSEILAVVRCTYCLFNLCQFCLEAHKRQRNTSDHVMISLKQSEQTAPAVTMVRRQLMCTSHNDQELNLYCSSCEQVVCRECCLFFHRGHPCELTTRAAQIYTSQLNERLEITRQLQKDTNIGIGKLSVIAHRIERRCEQVEEEIDKFIELYKKALDDHAAHLKEQVAEARKAKLQVINHHQQEVGKLIDSTKLNLKFGDDLIHEGSDTEILSFATTLLRNLDDCCKNIKTSPLPELKSLETLNFLPNEKAGTLLNRQMFGVITTQRISPSHSSLAADGFSILNNCRQQQKTEVVLVTRDCDGNPICHGGEQISADIRYRDVSRRALPVSIVDRQDGSYFITFTPDSAGNMVLSVNIKGIPIKGSPFPVCVRTLRPHHGTFHCCSFCSSGGRKDSICGCGGLMPGGFRGCGHGHVGHPGRRHWSCCGNTLHHSECGRPPAPLLHFSL